MYLKIKKLLFIPVGIALFVLGACSQDDAFNIGDSANRSFASNVETLQSGAVVRKEMGHTFMRETFVLLTNNWVIYQLQVLFLAIKKSQQIQKT